jgi:hypothetical protein
MFVRKGEIFAGHMPDIKYRAFNERFWCGGLNGKKKKISTVYPTGSMEGKPGFVIGGGPSASMVDLKLLKDKFTIGTNFIWKFFDFDCTIDICTDKTVIKNRMLNDDKFRNSKSIKLLMDLDNVDWDYHYTRGYGYMGFSTDVDWLYHGSHTGFEAVQLAIALKCDPIYLIGIDFCIHEGKGHCHDDWGEPGKYDKVLTRFNKEFYWFCQNHKNGANIINLSPISATKEYLPTHNYYEVLDA